MTDRRIRAARQAELKAFVEANATEHEKADLIFASAAGVRVKFGFTLRDLAAAADPDEDYVPTGKFRYNPEALAEIAGRIKLRRELRLPARECVVRKPPPEASHCICLTETLDSLVESGQAMTRGEVLKAARKAHTERWAWLKNRPKPRPEPLAAGPGQRLVHKRTNLFPLRFLPLSSPRRRPSPSASSSARPSGGTARAERTESGTRFSEMTTRRENSMATRLPTEGGPPVNPGPRPAPPRPAAPPSTVRNVPPPSKISPPNRHNPRP